jgi:transposase
LLDTQLSWYNKNQKEVSKMANQRRRYTPEFKQEIIKLITEQGKPVRQVAQDIEVHESVIRRWVKTYEAEGIKGFPGNGKLKPEDAELRALQKELADLREENAILKKAVAIFTKPTK